MSNLFRVTKVSPIGNKDSDFVDFFVFFGTLSEYKLLTVLLKQILVTAVNCRPITLLAK